MGICASKELAFFIKDGTTAANATGFTFATTIGMVTATFGTTTTTTIFATSKELTLFIKEGTTAAVATTIGTVTSSLHGTTRSTSA
jgi:hypothetical protein